VIRVTALTSGKRTPSARFRVRQHVTPLRALGVDVREHAPVIDKNRPLPLWPTQLSVHYIAPVYLAWELLKASSRVSGVAASHAGDITWLQRELLPGYPTLERFLKHPLVFDVDDAIWIARPFGRSSIAAIARRSAVCIVGNTFLAEWFGRYAAEVRIVPTAIDTERFSPAPTRAEEGRGRFTVGWTGTRANLSHLDLMLPALEQFMTRRDDVELVIVADSPPDVCLPGGRVRFVKWRPDLEAEILREFDVGIMPLADTEWTRGKCSFKMLQYMAVGVPVIVSPVGMNRDVLALGSVGLSATNPAEWLEAFERLYADREAARTMGKAGRAVVEQSFSRTAVTALLADVFRSLV
jgi:glycosyltransferase involved in cell wall biosynthesis